MSSSTATWHCFTSRTARRSTSDRLEDWIVANDLHETIEGSLMTLPSSAHAQLNADEFNLAARATRISILSSPGLSESTRE